MRFPAEVMKRQIGTVLRAWGMSAGHVEITVDCMVEADLRGIDSHGIGMMPQYDDYRQAGKLNLTPDIRTVSDWPTLALIDADNALGHVPAKLAMEAAIEKAKVLGIGVAAVRRSNHFGAAGVYSTMALDHGLVGFCCTGTSQRSIVPTFAREPMFSTNPIAFAAPAKRNRPFSLDMATSTVAVGKLNIARRAGKALPVGWALTQDGSPETDAAAAFNSRPRRMTPLGGTREGGSHKGYGLAVMVDILGSVLTGSGFGGRDLKTGEPGRYIDVGHFFMALDPALFRGEPGAFEADLDTVIDRLHATPAADPAQPVLVAGEPEAAAREERVAHGIPMTETLFREIEGVAGRAGVPFVLGEAA